MSTPTVIPHWLDGASFLGSARSGAAARTGDVTNPATGAVTGQVAFADQADAERVIGAASAAAARRSMMCMR